MGNEALIKETLALCDLVLEKITHATTCAKVTAKYIPPCTCGQSENHTAVFAKLARAVRDLRKELSR